jgi:uncharacterized protein YxjI
MDILDNLESLIVSQKKEWGEILTGFETKNSYNIFNPDGTHLFTATEEGGNFLLRWFLKALRPFTLELRGMDNSPFITLKRPFRFYYHELEIKDSNGIILGLIKRKFSIFRREYTVFNKEEQSICELFGPLLHPWTFNIQADNRTVGKITKKWSGLLKEGLTDADNFGIQFPAGWSSSSKTLLLGSLFLIDFVHFENKN